jgi:hypothetical protein
MKNAGADLALFNVFLSTRPRVGPGLVGELVRHVVSVPQGLLASLLGLGRGEVCLNLDGCDVPGTGVLKETSMLCSVVLVIVTTIQGFDDRGAVNYDVRGGVGVCRQKAGGKLNGQEFGCDCRYRPLCRYTSLE